jgi:hypothetical protein
LIHIPKTKKPLKNKRKIEEKAKKLLKIWKKYDILIKKKAAKLQCFFQYAKGI